MTAQDIADIKARLAEMWAELDRLECLLEPPEPCPICEPEPGLATPGTAMAETYLKFRHTCGTGTPGGGETCG